MSSALEIAFLKARRAEKSGDHEEAHRLFSAILARYPKNRKAVDAITRLNEAGGQGQSALQTEFNDIVALYGQGHYGQAARQAEALLARHPDATALHGLLGAAYLGLNDLIMAQQAFEQAVAANPQDAAFHNNLGITLRRQNKLARALTCYDEAIRLKPDYADAYYNRANLRSEQQQVDAAIADYTSALQHRPNYAEAYYNLGNLYRNEKRHEEAMHCYKQALAQNYNEHDILTSMGSIHYELKNMEAAILAFEAANLIKQDNFISYITLGHIFYLMERLDQSRSAYVRALEIRPNSHYARAQLLYLEATICDWTNRDMFAAIPLLQEQDDPAIQAFFALPFEDDPARQLIRSQIAVRSIMPEKRPEIQFSPSQHQKIRIGYFSADFYDHATLHLMSGLFREHDRERFEIRAYSFIEDDGTGRRQAIMNHVDAFLDIQSLTDAQAIELARADALDIAIDLKGHTRDARPGIFAGRVAPVQIGYLGYPGSIGGGFLDYIIADDVVIPQGDEHHYSEKIIRLPGCYQANDNKRAIGFCPADRTELGLPEKGFVFCSFNQSYKISPDEFSIWMRLLQQVEGSVLWLFQSNPWAQDNLRAAAGKHGIDPSRLIFAEKLPHADHLARHKHADLFLDSFFVNAHTTASDALWGGLPVLTMAGQQFAARVGASLLTAIGLPDLIATSRQEYEAKALELAQSPEKLKAIRAQLVENRLTTPLYDTIAHSRAIESAYETAHNRRVQGLAPDHLSIRH